jgi:hypothetical protein
MANLIVTFTSARPSPAQDNPAPVMVGSMARTEIIEIPSSSDGDTSSALEAEDNENIVSLYAEAACWVAVGTTPAVETTDGAYGHFIPAETPVQLWVEEGEKVAVIEA